ncbi:hypothetical protein [Clostridium beijerinckii]|uniref:hypothetical protein n=1 Tax=Clostridium beijerinckii TaxID=1520 RepID=UPI00047BE451|nr:hypothetical protein [Clostridium beijerinckii]
MTLDEKLTALFSDTDNTKLIIYRGMAADAIRNHLNLDSTITNDMIEINYESALIQLMDNKIKYEDTQGIKSYTMSKTSVTYVTNNGLEVTPDVAALLPRPFAKLLG